MDEGSAKAVRVAFKRLYDRDLAYRTEALINWCPGCRTSVSDLEVDPDAGDGHALDDPLPPDRRGDRPAATRTETITRRDDPPRDDPRRHRGRRPSGRRRYAALVGRRVRIPFVERDVPIIADDVVDPAFGTGAVKITPAHDHDDYETGQRHGLPMTTILDDAAAINETGHGLRRAGPVRGADARSSPTSRPAATSPASAPHEMVIGRCQRIERRHRAAAQDPVVHPHRAARRARARRRRGAGGPGSCPSGSRRPGSTG